MPTRDMCTWSTSFCSFSVLRLRSAYGVVFVSGVVRRPSLLTDDWRCPRLLAATLRGGAALWWQQAGGKHAAFIWDGHLASSSRPFTGHMCRRLAGAATRWPWLHPRA